MSKSMEPRQLGSLSPELSLTGRESLVRHSTSSFGVQAVMIISYSW